MSRSLNKVTLIGNIGRDPEIRSLNNASGKEVATLSIATSESWEDKTSGERKERTEWHRAVIYNEGLVNVVKNYVKKGARVYVEGQLETRKWVDSSGIEKYTTEVILRNYSSNFIILDSRGDGSSGPSGSAGAINNVAEEPPMNFDHSKVDDKIPF